PNLLRFLAIYGAEGNGGFFFRFDMQSQANAPTANDDAYSAAAGPLIVGPRGVLSNDTDPRNLPLSAALVQSVTRGGLLFRADGSFTYTPPADAPTVHETFRYKASNGAQESN